MSTSSKHMKRVDLNNRSATTTRGQLQEDGSVLVPENKYISDKIEQSCCSNCGSTRNSSRASSKHSSRHSSRASSKHTSRASSRHHSPTRSVSESKHASVQSSRKPSPQRSCHASRPTSKHSSRHSSRAQSPSRISADSIKQIKEAYASGRSSARTNYPVEEVSLRDSIIERRRGIEENQRLSDYYQQEIERQTASHAKQRRQIIESCSGPESCDPHIMVSAHHPEIGPFFMQVPCNLDRPNKFQMTIGNFSVCHEN
jgi:hypothetical protein